MFILWYNEAIFLTRKPTNNILSDRKLKKFAFLGLKRRLAASGGAGSHFTALLFGTSCLDQWKAFFIYAVTRKYGFWNDRAVNTKRHATGCFGAFCHGELFVALLRRRTDWASGAFKWRILWNLLSCLFRDHVCVSSATWFVAPCYLIMSLSIAFSRIVTNIFATFRDEVQECFVDAFPSKNIFILYYHAEFGLRASGVCQRRVARFKGRILTSRTPEITCYLAYFSFATWLGTPRNVVFPLATTCLFVGIDLLATFCEKLQHFLVDAFPNKNVFIPQSHAKFCFRTSCVGQRWIAGLLGGVLASWAPVIALHRFA